jgi:hypothetical protein
MLKMEWVAELMRVLRHIALKLGRVIGGVRGQTYFVSTVHAISTPVIYKGPEDLPDSAGQWQTIVAR